LLFCYIEKVGCRSFNELFRNVRLRYDPRMNTSHPWWLNTPSRHRVSKAGLEGMLADPQWHKAVFYREPLERFLSGYRSKCEQYHPDGVDVCRMQFGKFPIGFPDAVKVMATSKKPRNVRMNEHFEPQGHFCGGLAQTVQYYDTVEQLTRETSREKVMQLLQKVGVKPQAVPDFDRIYPAPGKGPAVTEHSHNTGSSQHFIQYYESVTIGAFKRLVEFFRRDYDLFHVKEPCI